MLYFYPRSPCGERHSLTRNPDSRSIFLSTLSLRRATEYSQIKPQNIIISIHALLAESDAYEAEKKATGEFLSTLSLRRATSFWITVMMSTLFLSTLSLRRATAIRGIVLKR